LELFRFSPGETSARQNKKLITFLVFLGVSVFFWFITTFSKDYTSTIVFPLSYLNAPRARVIVNRLPATIDVDINASGFTILYYKLLERSQPIKIDLRELKTTRDQWSCYLAVNTRLEKIARQFGNKMRILRVSPDTVFVDYSKRVSKVVPVKLKGLLTYNKDFQLKDSIELIPSKVTISGPEEQVNRIKQAETQPVNLEDISHNLKEDVKMALVNDTSLIEVSNPMVQVLISVTKYTEQTLELPVQADNLPKGYSLKTFPDKIALKFTAPLEELSKMDASSFRVRVDYARRTGSKKLKVELVKKPAHVKSLMMNPEKVEFIVRK
jgi:hypothetical protein